MAIKVIYKTPYSDGLRLSQARQLIRQVRQYRREQPPDRLSELLLALANNPSFGVVELASQPRRQEALTEVILK